MHTRIRQRLFTALLTVGCGGQHASSDEASEAVSGAGSCSESTVAPTSSRFGTESSGGTAGGTDEGTSSGETECSGGGVEDCCCFVPPSGNVAATCDRTNLCAEIVVTCAHEDVTSCSLEDLTTHCDAAIDCALEALADGAAGVLRWRYVSGSLPGFSEKTVKLYLVGDGTAFLSIREEIDLDPASTSVHRSSLKPGPHFVDCAAQPDAIDRFGCVRDALGGTLLETCL